MDIVAEICDHCGKTVIKNHHADSSDMVRTGGSFLYLCDLPDSALARPILDLGGSSTSVRHYCPACLLEVVKEWIAGVMKRAPSKIDPSRIKASVRKAAA